MKKFNWLAGSLVVFVMGISAAMADDAPVGLAPTLGVEGGINISSFNGQTVDAVYESRLGFVGGFFLGLPLGPSLTLQPELLFEQKGGKLNGNDYQLSYVEIPILLDVSLIGPLGVILGPSFDANVVRPDGVTVSNTDVGLILGAQLNLSKILLSGRYELGLTDLNTDSKIQNGTFTLLVGLSFI